MFVHLLRKIDQFYIRDTGSSLAAIQAVRDELPDIITTDMMRPGMSGRETVERIRKIEGADTLWIIAISGTLATASCREKAFAVGCDECFDKPLGRESLREAIIRGLVRRGCWTVGMGLEQFGHVMEVVARTAAFGGSAKGKRPSLPKPSRRT